MIQFLHYYKGKNILFLIFLFLFIGVTSESYGQQTGCPNDFDCDGVPDDIDVDDDNDGIFDHIESPQYYYIDKAVFESGDRISFLDVSTDLNYGAGNTSLLLDGERTAASAIYILANQSIVGKEIVRLTSKVGAIEFSNVALYFTAGAFFTTSSRVVLQGSTDGVTWIDLTESVAPGVGSIATVNVTKNQGMYVAYRMMGRTGTTTLRFLADVFAKVGQYNPSHYPIDNHLAHDIDKDGNPNHRDLNSDGDSCYDVIEAGFLDPDGDGMLGNSPVTVDQYGMVTSAIGYITPKNLYYLDATKNVCTGEGIPLNEDALCVDNESITNDSRLIQSGFHNSIVRTKTGFSVFGAAASPTVAGSAGNLLNSTPVIPANGFAYEGEIIDGTIGGTTGSQFFVLSTGGLYAWGSRLCVPTSWTTNNLFQKIDLPAGIAPRDIKLITAGYGVLALLTKSGDVYIAQGASAVGGQLFGDGSTLKDDLWHKSNISHVVSLTINGGGQALALTLSGGLYTWGSSSILGDGRGIQNLNLPTKMVLPTAINSVKMVALTQYTGGVAYFILGDDKRVYSMGTNKNGLLGIGSSDLTATLLSWQTVKSPTGVGFLENIKFINATAHSTTTYGSAAGAIDEKGMPYLWGNNHYYRLGAGGLEAILLPRIPNRSTPGEYDVIYVEPGGHITPLIDRKIGKFGYVGHKIDGSMGDGTTADTSISSYDFRNTPEIDFCNIIIGGPKQTAVIVNPMNINTKPEKK